MSRRTRMLILLSAPALLICTGCGPGVAPVAEVSGVITKNGKPLPKVSVQFLPDPEKGTSGPIAAGTTDENGHYEITCADGRSGAVVGWNRVVLNDVMPRGQRPVRVSREEEDTPEAEKKLQKGGARVAPSSRIPDLFTASGRTPLIKEVRPEQPPMNFDVARPEG